MLEDGAGFSTAVRAWFSERFGQPTEVQQRAWAAVAAGESVLAIAPTGSGKTLAAFLWAIDELAFRSGRDDAGIEVLYISPLKALAADVERNLRAPLAGIADEAREQGLAMAEVSVGMRTGDTPPEERRALVRRPPRILITTPESLYLMLTSKARETLAGVRTVIVDEIHSLAGSKRGAHLSVSLERLDALLAEPAQRIGLSATVRPVEEVARFLGGERPVRVVAQEPLRRFELAVQVPVADMTAIPARPGAPRAGRRADKDAWKTDRTLRAALSQGGDARAAQAPDSRAGSSSIWPYVEQAVLDEVLAHRSTIVFVNSRGVCERFTARLNELYAQRSGLAPAVADVAGGTANRSDMGSTSEMAADAPVQIAKAHHGSVAKERRLAIERELKAGELRCVVATSSLELGIDMGAVDLVMQIAPPLSVSSGLQRIGRANHSVGGLPRGLMFPLNRTEVVGCAVAAEGMHAGDIELTRIISWPLDVLAQQTVAQVSIGEIAADEWFAVVRRAAGFADMPRAAFDAVMSMLAGRYSAADGTGFAPCIAFDAQTGMLSPLPGAQRLAVAGAGTIPDRGLFPVVLAEGSARKGRKRVGELDEEMVHESRVGDVITLGTSVWRIKQIAADRVVVEPAPGRGSRLPFWHGERPARSFEDGVRRGAFLREAAASIHRAEPDAAGRGSGERWVASKELEGRLARAGLDANARRNLVALLAEQRCATGAVPSDKVLVVEKCPDEAGGLRMILHSPFGRRVHEPWALAVARRIESEHGFDAKVMAADDGIVVLTPSAEEFDVPAEAFALDADEAEAIVRASVTSTALFTARFRECAARALLMRPQVGGKRAPLWLQRVKGGQLLEAALRFGDFPLVMEAMRECMQDVYDMAALREVLERLAAGAVRLVQADTEVPSPFAAPLVFGYVGEHLYDEDMPHAERAAALLSVDARLLSEVLGSADLSTLLDAQVVEEVEQRLQCLAPDARARDAEGIARLLRVLGPLDEEQLRLRAVDDALVRPALDELCAQKRAFPFAGPQGRRWAAAADARVLHDAIGAEAPAWALADALEPAQQQERPLDLLVARFARTHGPFSAAAAARALGAGAAVAAESLARLGAQGKLVQAAFGADERGEARAWVDAEVLQRLKARSLAQARAAVQPVPLSAYQRFLLDAQGIAAEGLLEGPDGVAEVIAQMEGIALEAQLWEGAVLPARVHGYKPAFLDELLESGEVVWVGSSAGEGGKKLVAFYPSDSPFAPVAADEQDAVENADAAALAELVWRGAAVCGTFEPVRRLHDASPLPKGAPRARRATSRRGRRGAAFAEASRRAAAAAIDQSRHAAASFGAVRAVQPAPVNGTEAVLGVIESVLDAYGIASADTAALAGVPGGIGSLRQALDRMEETGALVRGVFVEGLGPAQFAARETVEAVRACAAEEQAAAAVVIAANDPACLQGRGIPWPAARTDRSDEQPARRNGALVALVDGELVLYAAPGLRWLVTFAADEAQLACAVRALVAHIQREARRLGSSAARKKHLVERIDGVAAPESPLAPLLVDAGFVRLPDGLRLYADPF